MGMNDDNERQSRLARMDDAFCARLRATFQESLDRQPLRPAIQTFS